MESFSSKDHSKASGGSGGSKKEEKAKPKIILDRS